MSIKQDKQTISERWNDTVRMSALTQTIGKNLIE